MIPPIKAVNPCSMMVVKLAAKKNADTLIPEFASRKNSSRFAVMILTCAQNSLEELGYTIGNNNLNNLLHSVQLEC